MYGLQVYFRPILEPDLQAQSFSQFFKGMRNVLPLSPSDPFGHNQPSPTTYDD